MHKVSAGSQTMPLKDTIRHLREQRGWSQSRLSQEASISQPTIWRLEKGIIANPKMALLQKLAAAFEVPVDMLVEDGRQLSFLEGIFPGDPIGQALLRGYEKLPTERRQQLLNFLNFIASEEAKEAGTRKEG